MKVQDLIQKIRSRLKPQEQLPNEAVLGCLRMLEDARWDQISCDETYSELDEYVDCEVDCKDAAHVMPLVREHLDLCPECCDEYEALLGVVENTDENSN